jgi:septal ring factor EnvC (AmiA/AmiB activator)
MPISDDSKRVLTKEIGAINKAIQDKEAQLKALEDSLKPLNVQIQDLKANINDLQKAKKEIQKDIDKALSTI